MSSRCTNQPSGAASPRTWASRLMYQLPHCCNVCCCCCRVRVMAAPQVLGRVFLPAGCGWGDGDNPAAVRVRHPTVLVAITTASWCGGLLQVELTRFAATAADVLSPLLTAAGLAWRRCCSWLLLAHEGKKRALLAGLQLRRCGLPLQILLELLERRSCRQGSDLRLAAVVLHCGPAAQVTHTAHAGMSLRRSWQLHTPLSGS